MATCRQVITRSLRMLGVVSEGQPAPAAYDAQNALDAFKTMLTAYVAEGVFGPLTNVTVEEDYTAGENERIADISGSNVTITLPTTVEDVDPCTGAAVTRAPYHKSVVLVAGTDAYLYDADNGAWSQIGSLTLDDYAPLSLGLSRGLSAMIAGNLAPDYGAQLSPIIVSLATSTHASLRRKPPIQVAVATPLLRTLGRFWR